MSQNQYNINKLQEPTIFWGLLNGPYRAISTEEGLLRRLASSNSKLLLNPLTLCPGPLSDAHCLPLRGVLKTWWAILGLNSFYKEHNVGVREMGGLGGAFFFFP